LESAWTIDALKQYVDRTIESVDKRITADVLHAKESAQQAQANAILANGKAEKASDDRFASHNEFNKRIDNILGQTVTLAAFTQHKDTYAADKLELSNRLSNCVSMAQLAALSGRVDGVASRVNAKDSEGVGKDKVVDNTRANIAIIVSLITALSLLLPAVFNIVRPLAPPIQVTK
jgi:hypothetical protein